jgi:hypothetical protein
MLTEVEAVRTELETSPADIWPTAETVDPVTTAPLKTALPAMVETLSAPLTSEMLEAERFPVRLRLLRQVV